MERLAHLAAELQALRTFFNDATTSERRLELLQSLERHRFADAEHQVVFDSIRALFPGGAISAQRLAVHLNNRGFPDIDLDKYFTATRVSPASTEIPAKEKA